MPRVAIFLCGFAAFIDLYATQGLLREIGRSFDITPSHAGLSITATTLAVALTAPFVGLLTERFDRRQVIAWTVLMLTLPTLGAAWAASFDVFLAMRFIQGLFIPVIFAVTVAHIGEQWQGGPVTELTSLYIAGTTLGGFGGRFITGLVAASWGWRFGFCVLAALTALTGLMIFALLPRPYYSASARGRSNLQSLARHLGNRHLLSAFAIGLCILFSQVATFTYVELRLIRPPFSLGTAAIGSLYAVFLLAVVVTPMAGRLGGQRRHAALLVSAIAIGSTGLLLTLLPSLTLILLGLALSSTGVFLSQAAASAFITSITPASRASAIGLYLAFYYVGGSLGAIVPAPLWHRAGWSGCVALVLSMQALAAIIALFFWKESAYPRSRNPTATEGTRNGSTIHPNVAFHRHSTSLRGK